MAGLHGRSSREPPPNIRKRCRSRGKLHLFHYSTFLVRYSSFNSRVLPLYSWRSLVFIWVLPLLINGREVKTSVWNLFFYCSPSFTFVLPFHQNVRENLKFGTPNLKFSLTNFKKGIQNRQNGIP